MPRQAFDGRGRRRATRPAVHHAHSRGRTDSRCRQFRRVCLDLASELSGWCHSDPRDDYGWCLFGLRTQNLGTSLHRSSTRGADDVLGLGLGCTREGRARRSWRAFGCAGPSGPHAGGTPAHPDDELPLAESGNRCPSLRRCRGHVFGLSGWQVDRYMQFALPLGEF